MHLLWESSNWPGSTVEPSVVWLSWLNVSPKNSNLEVDEVSGDSGYLACGSQSGAVGITATDANVRLSNLDGKRLNYNLRGHHSPVCRVSWNQQQQKLASCDESGIIYVWARYEDRWSVELVNDRGIRVRDFSWSSSGNFALICYLDNFVLVGSAAGQRVWSTTFENHTVLCGTWEPTTKRVVLGTANGLLLLVGEDGNLLSEHEVLKHNPIEHLEWSCIRSSDQKSSLCLVFHGGLVYLMDGCDDAGPTMIRTDLDVVHMQWSTSGDYLAVVGTKDNSSHLKIFYHDGSRLYGERIPGDDKGHVSGFTWGHNDQVVFASVGGLLNVGRVYWDTPTLKILASLSVFRAINEHLDYVDDLPLPLNDKAIIKSHGSHVVECRIPNALELCQSMCRPSTSRFYCSIRPAPGQAAHTWELCCEHAGGLVPVLGACVTNKLRPEFEIWLGSAANPSKKEVIRSAAPSSPTPPIVDHGTKLDRGGFQRDSVWRRSKRQLQAMVHRAQQTLSNTPKVRKKLALVTSNVWCTRFKIVGLDSEFLAPYLGEVTYKTSVLHLQPRQMTVQLVDLNRSFTHGLPPLPPMAADCETTDSVADENLMAYIGEGPPVAPMPAEIFSSTVHRVSAPSFGDPTPYQITGADKDTEFPYVDLSASDFLYSEEGQLLKQLIDEFSELKQAADKHIRKMRHFAYDLQSKSRVLDGRQQPSVGNGPQSTSSVETTSSVDAQATPISTADVQATSVSSAVCRKAVASVTDSSDKKNEAADDWFDFISEQLDFIDEDESLVITNEIEKCRLKPRSLSLAGLPESESVPNSLHSTENANGRPMSAGAIHIPATESPAAAFSRMENDSRCAVVRGGACKQLREVSTVLEKLCKLATDLAPKHAQDQILSAHVFSGNSKISPNQRSKPAMTMDSGDTGPYAQMFQRFHEVSQRVVQLENLLSYGSELLDEVRYDLLERVQRIRSVLDTTPRPLDDRQASVSQKSDKNVGKRFLDKPENHLDVCNSPSSSAISGSQGNQGEILTLQNKTPFWNEAVQVYQLDFGGRVTQESAKNFQIEYQNKQVMQFGRIENGGYTLDFEAPFTAVQAFAVALASITQRFK